MTLARNWTVATASVTPCIRARRRTCCIIGLPTMGSIGLGWLLVSGRSRVPWPPAMITALIRHMIPRGSAPHDGRGRRASGRRASPDGGEGGANVEPVEDRRSVVEGDGRPEHDPPGRASELVEPQPEVPPRDPGDGGHEAERG